MHYQKKEEQYEKWNEDVWNSIEKELSLFQKKVTDSMIMLGDLNKTQVQDFMVPPVLDTDVILGEQFYIQMIRPICVKKNYLPKRLPGNQDFKQEDLDSEDEIVMNKNKQRKKVVNEEDEKQKLAVKGKKGGKNNQGKGNSQKMKIKIAKENFQKDIQLVLKSHSMERLQVEFGFRHDKIQVKLMTFFYIAAYIKKNRVQQKMEESLIFEVINILIKIVRIFKGLEGPSYMNTQQKLEVSPTLILDLRMCINGMKQYYKYDNRTVILKYPKLVYYTSYDKYFPTLDIKPYKSQIQFIQAVKGAFNIKGQIQTPTLVLYKPMIGSGKTTASLALSQMVRDCKLLNEKNNKLQLIYCCVISSVRIQVGRYAYNKKQKFALCAMQPSIMDDKWAYPRVINSWGCRNQKIVDLMISDAYCAYEMSNRNYFTEKQKTIMQFERNQRKKQVIVGQVQRENIILFIDQPTAFCNSTESPATRKIFQILQNYPPKIIIMSSATMPQQKQLTNTIQLIRRKNPGLKVISVESKQFQIGCQYCSFKGDIIFPHNGVKTKAELTKIIELLQTNPFLLRLYTGPSLFFLLRRCQKVGLSKNLPKINETPQLRQEDIIKATFKILNILKKQSDELIEEVCKSGGDQINIDFKEKDQDEQDDEEEDEEEKQKQKQKRRDYINFKKMLRGDAHKFLGGCLIAAENPIQFAHAMFDKWVQDIKPIKRLMEKYHKDVKELQHQIQLILADPEMREEKKTQKISKLQSDKQPVIDFPQSKKINTSEHYQKYCKNKETVHNTMLIKPIPAASVGQELIDQVDDFILKLLFCGVGIFVKQGLSSKYLDKVEQLASQNYLAYIISDKTLCYGTNFPISNVILRDDLAEKLNMNEMFQLIGRAGRVGQSWTARAFLQHVGLQKLWNYIHKDSAKASQQGKIFQEIAQQSLDNPQLKLRTIRSQIRYRDFVENSNSIEILIKKKNIQDSDLIQQVVILPYILNNGEIKVLCKKPYPDINYFSLPNSEILYDDIPKIQNSKKEDIIDVALYYTDDVKFITTIINNACKRIINTMLEDKLDIKNQKNQFVPKLYVQHFCKQTKSMCIVFQEKQQKQVNGFTFQSLVSVGIQHDDITLQKFKKISDQAKRIVKRVRQNISGLTAYQFETFSKLHNEIMSRKHKIYTAMVEQCRKDAEQECKQLIDRQMDKEGIQFKKESIDVLTLERAVDIVNIYEKNFHVESKIRKIWDKVSNKLYEQ